MVNIPDAVINKCDIKNCDVTNVKVDICEIDVYGKYHSCCD